MPEIQYRENPVDEETKRQFDSKETSKFYDPCQDAANRSLKCLRRNMGDRDMCTDYFQAYRDCKKKWVRFLPPLLLKSIIPFSQLPRVYIYTGM